MEFNSPCDGCRHHDSRHFLQNLHHRGPEAASERAISDTRFTVGPDHLCSLVEYQRRPRHAVDGKWELESVDDKGLPGP